MGSQSLDGLWTINPFPLSGLPLYILIGLSLLIAISLISVRLESKFLDAMIAIVCIIISLVSMQLSDAFWLLSNSSNRFAGLLFLSIPIGCFLYRLFNLRDLRADYSFQLAFLFFISPYIYAFGTDRPYWLNQEGVAFFWILSGIVLIAKNKAIDKKNWAYICPVTCVAALLTSIFIFTSIEYPMRQTQSLRLNSFPVKIGNGTLLVSDELGKYISDLRFITAQGGLPHGAPLIDLTGISPGVPYILDTISSGGAWLLSGYPGSLDVAYAQLASEPCVSLSKAWILAAPDDPKGFPQELIKFLELKLGVRYIIQGFSLRPAETPYPTAYTHILLKPIPRIGLNKRRIR
jgi:uncharacterized membrane protein